ncbi:hypothetical protein ACFLX5_04735 [Chloroflexota bacterium]
MKKRPNISFGLAVRQQSLLTIYSSKLMRKYENGGSNGRHRWYDHVSGKPCYQRHTPKESFSGTRLTIQEGSGLGAAPFSN